MNSSKLTATSILLASVTLVAYCIYLVTGRFIASWKHIDHFGIDDKPWVALGLDTVITGASILFVLLVASFFGRRLGMLRSGLNRHLLVLLEIGSVIGTVLLVALLLSPGTAFR